MPFKTILAITGYETALRSLDHRLTVTKAFLAHLTVLNIGEVPMLPPYLVVAVRDMARETEIDLNVMGAFGHSRIRQNILGGTTQEMPENGEIPLILSR